MSFQSVANHISMESVFRSLLSCSCRVLNWLQTLSGIESCRKKFCAKFQVQELVKIIRSRVKIKDIKLFYNLLLNIKSGYICCGLHIKTLQKPSLLKNGKFHVMEVRLKISALIGWILERMDFSKKSFYKLSLVLELLPRWHETILYLLLCSLL